MGLTDPRDALDFSHFTVSLGVETGTDQRHRLLQDPNFLDQD
jgi:hypothetical protein